MVRATLAMAPHGHTLHHGGGTRAQTSTLMPQHGHTVHGGDMFATVFGLGAAAPPRRPSSKRKASVSFSETGTDEVARISPMLGLTKLRKANPNLVPMPEGANDEATWLLRPAAGDAANDNGTNLLLDSDTDTIVRRTDFRDGTLQVGDRIVAVDGVLVGSAGATPLLPDAPAFVHFFVHRVAPSSSVAPTNGEAPTTRKDGAVVPQAQRPSASASHARRHSSSAWPSPKSKLRFLGGLRRSASVGDGLMDAADAPHAALSHREADDPMPAPPLSTAMAASGEEHKEREALLLMRFATCHDALRMQFDRDGTVTHLQESRVGAGSSTETSRETSRDTSRESSRSGSRSGSLHGGHAFSRLADCLPAAAGGAGFLEGDVQMGGLASGAAPPSELPSIAEAAAAAAAAPSIAEAAAAAAAATAHDDDDNDDDVDGDGGDHGGGFIGGQAAAPQRSEEEVDATRPTGGGDLAAEGEALRRAAAASRLAATFRVGDRVVAINGTALAKADGDPSPMAAAPLGSAAAAAAALPTVPTVVPVRETLLRLAEESARRRGGLAGGGKGLVMFVVERVVVKGDEAAAEPPVPPSPRSVRAHVTRSLKQFQWQMTMYMDTHRTSLVRGGKQPLQRAHDVANRLASDLDALALRSKRYT